MANKNLNATITIGGAVSGTLKSALGTTTSKLQEIGRTVDQLKGRQRELNKVIQDESRIMREGSMTARMAASSRLQAAQQEVGAINREMEALRAKQSLLRREAELTKNIGEMRNKFRDEMFNRVGTAVAIGAIAREPLKAFEDLDAAINNMQVAMTDATGKVPAQFDEIKKQTVELGNILPGTTADFVNVATALKEQGVAIGSITGGALKSASHLAVVMKMVPSDAAEMTAKLREAFQLSDDEFGKMADFTQRAKFGFGMQPKEILEGAKVYAGKLNSLGLTGAENVRKIYALQGMAASQGLEGSQFGTNFSMMLTRVGMMSARLQKNSKEMKAVNAELKRGGVNLAFFDSKGKFAGVDNMVAQLNKLKNFSQQDRLEILTLLFGEEAGRPADLIARNGIEGYKAALEKMDNEATLEKRIQIATGSFKNLNEALSGTWTNLQAAFGAPLAELLTPVIKSLNDLVGGPLMEWADRNKDIVKGLGMIAAAVAGINLVGAALAGVGFSALTTYLSVMSVWKGLSLIGAAVAGISLPVVAAMAGIAAVGALIYTYWEPLKSFFSGFFEGLMMGLAPIGAALQAAFTPVAPVVAKISEAISSAFDWVMKFLKPVGEATALTKSWGEAGKIAGEMIGSAFAYVVEKVMQVINAFGLMTSAVQNAISSASGFSFGSVPVPKIGQTITPSETRQGPTQVAPPAPPAIPGGNTTSNNKFASAATYNQTFNIHQQPGESSDDLANKVIAKMKAKERSDNRGRMFDPAIAGAY